MTTTRRGDTYTQTVYLINLETSTGSHFDRRCYKKLLKSKSRIYFFQKLSLISKTTEEECFSLDSFSLTCSWVKSQLEISLPLIGSQAAVCHHGLPDEHHVKVLGHRVSQGPCFNVALSKRACKKIIFHVPLAFSRWLAFFAELCHNKVFNFKPKFVAIPARLLTIILVMNNG